MRLVPHQLQRNGMTGSVPYYGGRLGPAQAYAAAHSSQMTPGSVPPPAPAPHAAVPTRGGLQSIAALDQLRASGVITDAEYRSLASRVGQ